MDNIIKKSWNRGFCSGWADSKESKIEKVSFPRNNESYILGYHIGYKEFIFEYERDGRDRAFQDYQIGYYDENCDIPGYRSYYNTLVEKNEQHKEYVNHMETTKNRLEWLEYNNGR